MIKSEKFKEDLSLLNLGKKLTGKKFLVDNVPCLYLNIFKDLGGGCWVDLYPLKDHPRGLYKKGETIQVPYAQLKPYPGVWQMILRFFNNNLPQCWF